MSRLGVEAGSTPAYFAYFAGLRRIKKGSTFTLKAGFIIMAAKTIAQRAMSPTGTAIETMLRQLSSEEAVLPPISLEHPLEPTKSIEIDRGVAD